MWRQIRWTKRAAALKSFHKLQNYAWTRQQPMQKQTENSMDDGNAKCLKHSQYIVHVPVNFHFSVDQSGYALNLGRPEPKRKESTSLHVSVDKVTAWINWSSVCKLIDSLSHSTLSMSHIHTICSAFTGLACIARAVFFPRIIHRIYNRINVLTPEIRLRQNNRCSFVLSFIAVPGIPPQPHYELLFSLPSLNERGNERECGNTLDSRPNEKLNTRLSHLKFEIG